MYSSVLYFLVLLYLALKRSKPAQTEKHYVRLSSTEFKQGYGNHRQSFKKKKKRDLQNQTELSKHVWTIKDKFNEFSIQRKILKKAYPYCNITKRCNSASWRNLYNMQAQNGHAKCEVTQQYVPPCM